MVKINMTSKYFPKKIKLSSVANITNKTLANSNTNYHTSTSLRLGDAFFNVPCVTLAHNLLGKVLTRILDNGKRLSGRIVETESYLGGDDKASHSYQGRKTHRNSSMFMKPGTAYVYMTYGMHYCFNISSDGNFISIRIYQVMNQH